MPCPERRQRLTSWRQPCSATGSSRPSTTIFPDLFLREEAVDDDIVLDILDRFERDQQAVSVHPVAGHVERRVGPDDQVDHLSALQVHQDILERPDHHPVVGHDAFAREAPGERVHHGRMVSFLYYKYCDLSRPGRNGGVPRHDDGKTLMMSLLVSIPIGWP